MADGLGREVTPVTKRRRKERSTDSVSDSSSRRGPFAGFERGERVITQDALDVVTAGINAKVDKVSSDLNERMERIQSLLLEMRGAGAQPTVLPRDASVSGLRCATHKMHFESKTVDNRTNHVRAWVMTSEGR